MKKTKIIATLGPASMDKRIIKEMVEAGLDCIRINTSHGDFEQYSTIINNVREVKDLPIFLDTSGPNVRIKSSKELKVKKDDEIVIGFNGKNSLKDLSFTYNFHSKIKVNDPILLNDGLLELRVKEKMKNALFLTALSDGIIKNGTDVNLPTVEVKLPILSPKDKDVLSFAKKMDVDFIALSFTRNKKDILKARKLLNGCHVGIIAKIESKEGIKNYNEILNEADGIMVARGDLGVEVPAENVPLLQKDFIQKANQAGKISIVATQMLSSMIDNPRPTRAETSDVANAILDGADCILLSNETTIGKYPVEAIKEMNRISLITESAVENRVINERLSTISDTISKALYNMSKYMNADKIFIITKTGFTARIISRFKPKQEILAITNDAKVRKKLSLVYGVTPVLYENMPEHEKILSSVKYCVDTAFIQKNDTLLIAAGLYTEEPNVSNIIGVYPVKDLLKYYETEFNLKISNSRLVCSNCGIKLPLLYCCKTEMVVKNNRLVCEICGKEIPLSKAREMYEKSNERKLDLVKETLDSAKKWFSRKKIIMPFKKEKNK